MSFTLAWGRLGSRTPVVLRATTHWLTARELARRHPAIEVDPDVLYVDNGRILTSAGAAAGLDLCLHLVRRDLGAEAAAQAARAAVMPLERDGGQQQFIVQEPPSVAPPSIGPLLIWIEQNLRKDLSLPIIARRDAFATMWVRRQRTGLRARVSVARSACWRRQTCRSRRLSRKRALARRRYCGSASTG